LAYRKDRALSACLGSYATLLVPSKELNSRWLSAWSTISHRHNAISKCYATYVKQINTDHRVLLNIL